MGNNSTKPERGGSGPTSPMYPEGARGHRHNHGEPSDRNPGQVYSSRSGRGASRHDLSFLGIGSSSATADELGPRRETKAEREARKLEKERIAREKERERSMREEHVDGGYLVTQGVYTGTEDFNKAIVRQLMIERRLAPFWRGLDDHKDTWTEAQLIAAARGLPIPAPDAIPPDEIPHHNAANPGSSNLQNLTVPITSRSQSNASDASSHLSPSHPAFSLPSPASSANPPTSSSPFRPRSKTLASLSSSRNQTSSDMVPREIQLPVDPYINGQRIEVYLYKEAPECIICMLSYPPYLNRTRCCDQPICSECFVQIKRPDPHPPEHHDDPSNSTPADQDEDAEMLVSEPSQCPYCQLSEFGVTYEPPPFRRGLAYANGGNGPASPSSAMSSSSSVNSTTNPSILPNGSRRRAISLAANDSSVITTDRIRPDWATKLANARNHAARRSAAATALHTAAYLMGNGNELGRSFGFGGRSRFGRNRRDSPDSASGPGSNERASGSPSQQESSSGHARVASGGSSSHRRRSRMDDLEDMMMAEAIRLSLVAEEERKRKEEKENKKLEKKKEKEAKKAEKAAKKNPYGQSSSAGASSLSLHLPVIGRRRGNSGSSLLQGPHAPDGADIGKGKSVDRGLSVATSSAMAIGPGSSSRNAPSSSSSPAALSQPMSAHSPTTATAPEKPSHLRQMSNASSPASSFMEPHNPRADSSSSLDSPDASRMNLAADNSSGQGGTPDQDNDGSSPTESMFNFRSLAAMIGSEEGASDEKEDAQRHIEYMQDREPLLSHSQSDLGESSHHNAKDEQGGNGTTKSPEMETPRLTGNDELQESVATLRVDGHKGLSPSPKEEDELKLEREQDMGPEVMVTPVTPVSPARDAKGVEGTMETEVLHRERGEVTQ